jgi:hypothetical protein
VTAQRQGSIFPHIPADARALVSLAFRYDDRKDAIRASKAIHDIARCAPEVLFVHHPKIEELEHNVSMPQKRLLEEFSAAVTCPRNQWPELYRWSPCGRRRRRRAGWSFINQHQLHRVLLLPWSIAESRAVCPGRRASM